MEFSVAVRAHSLKSFSHGSHLNIKTVSDPSELIYLSRPHSELLLDLQVFSCLALLLDTLKPWLQNLHEYGLSPVCINVCLIMFVFIFEAF